MSRPFKSALLLLALLCSGCQSLAELDGDGSFGTVAALYASAPDASAVARGQFGAVPIALAAEHELQAAVGCPGLSPSRLLAQCMRHIKTGQLGWLPARSAAPLATPAASVLHQS